MINIMKYTERHFKFPVRIYDRFSAQKAEDKERETDMPVEPDWAAGMARVKYYDIDFWTDYYDSYQGIEGVKEKGFQYTLVTLRNGEMFICTWDRAKFEDKLDEFVVKYEKWSEDQLKPNITTASDIT